MKLRLVLFALTVALAVSCAPKKTNLSRRFEFRNVQQLPDGRMICDIGDTALDAQTGRTIVFCKPVKQ
jgi:hypothetical protein